MPKPSLARRTSRWRSTDRIERHVRAMLETRDDYFENHDIGKHDRGTALPLMVATVPGQHNKCGHGIDIFALDFDFRLWVIEVSAGRRFGATVAKGGGAVVKYAGGVQMSAKWRDAAKERFLQAESGTGYEKIKALLDLPENAPEKTVRSRFDQLYSAHRKAVIIPEGGHFLTDGTDIDFVHDVYTFPEKATLLDMWYDSRFE